MHCPITTTTGEAVVHLIAGTYHINNSIDNNDYNLEEPFMKSQDLNDIEDSGVSDLRHDYVSNSDTCNLRRRQYGVT